MYGIGFHLLNQSGSLKSTWFPICFSKLLKTFLTRLCLGVWLNARQEEARAVITITPLSSFFTINIFLVNTLLQFSSGIIKNKSPSPSSCKKKKKKNPAPAIHYIIKITTKKGLVLKYCHSLYHSLNWNNITLATISHCNSTTMHI